MVLFISCSQASKAIFVFPPPPLPPSFCSRAREPALLNREPYPSGTNPVPAPHLHGGSSRLGWENTYASSFPSHTPCRSLTHQQYYHCLFDSQPEHHKPRIANEKRCWSSSMCQPKLRTMTAIQRTLPTHQLQHGVPNAPLTFSSGSASSLHLLLHLWSSIFTASPAS